MFRYFIATVLLAVALVSANECDQSKCQKVGQHYRELGCTPVKDPSGCCIIRYDCANIQGRSADKCYIGGKNFEKGIDIPKETINFDCAAVCRCSGFDNAELSCAISECPEHIGPRPDPKCVLQYGLDDCCFRTKVCEDAEIAKLETCELEGKTYKEGQRMYPAEDTCQTCVCGKGFTGKLEAPFCKPVSCGIEIFHNQKVKDNCAPVYYGTDRCCPIEWLCHQETDVVKSASNSKATEDPAMTCKYGDVVLNLGDTVAPTNEKCTTCGCHLPPMVTCVKDHECYLSS